MNISMAGRINQFVAEETVEHGTDFIFLTIEHIGYATYVASMCATQFELRLYMLSLLEHERLL